MFFAVLAAIAALTVSTPVPSQGGEVRLASTAQLMSSTPCVIHAEHETPLHLLVTPGPSWNSPSTVTVDAMLVLDSTPYEIDVPNVRQVDIAVHGKDPFVVNLSMMGALPAFDGTTAHGHLTVTLSAMPSPGFPGNVHVATYTLGPCEFDKASP